ncbi:hypothetical protein FLACHUCJ7_02038 [Flavobacterium chungangense]|uniref:Uncharacterized protein n=1 Tax=Flavobacterium chungangense TaxID=554283 RepID=A0A6V6YZ91_9FLAO|nr:hypothetical protein FLACHUCJ7_02038 [Flavobacterium chungangense]
MSIFTGVLYNCLIFKILWYRSDHSLFFMQKVRVAMKISQQYPLSETVHVYEFVLGGK